MAILQAIQVPGLLHPLCDDDSINSRSSRIEEKSVARRIGKEQIPYIVSAPLILRHFPDATVCDLCGLQACNTRICEVCCNLPDVRI